jgi:hypothetical protein
MVDGERASQEPSLFVCGGEIMIGWQRYGTEASEGAATPFPMTVPKAVPHDAEFHHVTMNA